MEGTPRRIETLFLAGPAGRLEALLEEPEGSGPARAAVICHPHPQHGGTMHNKVVYRLARGLRRVGYVVLRFNYRGVNRSEGGYARGVGETEDARAALRFLEQRFGVLPTIAGGFSFGSRVALRLAITEASVRGVIAAGFPTRYPDREYVSEVRVPKYFIHSTVDEYGPRAEMAEFYDLLPQPKHLDWIPAADHFFRDQLDEFEAVVERIGRELEQNAGSNGSRGGN